MPAANAAIAGKSPSTLSDLSFFARARHITEFVLSTNDLWRELFNLSYFSIPENYAVAMTRVRRNRTTSESTTPWPCS
ncbi:hypothetical protein TIFTF001_049321 [Ficus carica]|uniref:Uncharacterized protein n=1 Tax=Ficus carica TaxID=3494 RepID=A0AA87Z1P1_FICCA|nr:hypothetical protein TIFTF001_049321 [Ficus carica]